MQEMRQEYAAAREKPKTQPRRIDSQRLRVRRDVLHQGLNITKCLWRFVEPEEAVVEHNR